MKTLVVMFATVLLASGLCYGFDAPSITFSIAPSATTATPNLRIGVVKGPLAKDGNIAVQGMPLPRPLSFYLTETKTYTFEEGTTAIEIQVDQDTKMYVGSDLTNYLLIYAGAPRIYTVK